MDYANEPVAPPDRLGALEAERDRKMAASAHAFVRGSTRHFYQHLARTAHPPIPAGPPIWICGDCHVGNLGPVASPDGAIAIQIRDLDQTVVGNPAFDLVRLSLSLAMAARSSDLPGVTTARMLEHMLAGYASAFQPGALDGDDCDDAGMPPTARRVMRAAAGRSWRHLAKERIEGHRRTLPLGKHFWPLTPAELAGVDALFQRTDVRRLATHLRARDGDDQVAVLDAAYWRKGCSSLGTLRIAVLVAVGHGRNERHCLIDIKEAVSSHAPPHPERADPATDPAAAARLADSEPRSHADRVVAGARALSPFLGERMLAASLLGRSVFLRELLPQDLKLEIEHLTDHEATRIATYLATVIGRAHARQLPEGDRLRWIATLHENGPADHDTPTWLWQTLLRLVATHEAAYLDHCRSWALRSAA